MDMDSSMKRRFSGRALRAMMLPLFVEQLLVMLVGIVDTLAVSYAGEAAVSGVSLVNQFNIIFIYLFLALASGGAVVISQYIGRRKRESAGETASQLLTFSAIFSLAVAALVLVGKEMLLSLLFGRVELLSTSQHNGRSSESGGRARFYGNRPRGYSRCRG